jgi:endonuclease IV
MTTSNTITFPSSSHGKQNRKGQPWQPQIGFHASLQGSGHTLLKQTVEAYSVPIQVYLPRYLPSVPYQAPSRPFFVHTSLTINLGLEDAQSRSYLRLARELQAVKNCDCSCVVHIGKARGCSLEQVLRQVNLLATELDLRYRPEARCPFPLLLENAAGQGYELGSSWDELRKLKEGLDTPAVGFCFDTQHAFGAGLCDYRTEATMENVFAWGEYLSPGQNWGCIHLNDSKVEFGRRVDRHAPLGQGAIWQNWNLPFFVKRATDYGIPLITETSDPMGDYQFLYSSCQSWQQKA